MAAGVRSAAAEDSPAPKAYRPPVYRIEADGFETSESDLRPLLDSVCRELWPHFPDYSIEPMVIVRSRSGPIVLHRRNDRGELVVKLDTGKTFWAQYSYQFAHEFCHVLCGVAKQGGERPQLWFEETLCETASLYALRSMSRSWKKSPPFSNWADFRDALRDYADNVEKERHTKYELYAVGLPAFYLKHRATLEANPTSRDLNGAMSLVLLPLFEEQPQSWESIRWLNAVPAEKDDSFETCLRKWHAAVPDKHKPFVNRISTLYGMAIEKEKS